MKIKEIENRIGITRANIRYYEDEGLIHPQRNHENNYREYSEEDVKQLERIKVLRTLGVSISDIRELQNGKYSLEQVMQKRIQNIVEEKKNLEELKKVCETIIRQDVSYESIDEHLLGEGDEREIWRSQIERIMREDITKEILTKSQMNTNIGVMLCWGYFLNIIVSFLLGDAILGAGIFPFAGVFLLCIGCYIWMCFTANMKAQIVIFHISALTLTPVIVGVYCIFSNIFTMGKTVNALRIGKTHLIAFWGVIIGYVGLLLILSKMWGLLFQKMRYVVGITFLYSVILTLVIGVTTRMWVFPFGMMIVFTLYIGINWFHTYQDIHEPSRYYAVSQSCRIMNFAGVTFNMRGKSVGPMVFR